MEDFCFASRLLETRKKRGLSQSDLADFLNTKPTAIGRYERGEARPFVEMAAKLAEALGVSLDYLVGNSDLKFNKDTINRIVDLQALSEEDQQPIFKILDSYLRDVKTIKAYVS